MWPTRLTGRQKPVTYLLILFSFPFLPFTSLVLMVHTSLWHQLEHVSWLCCWTDWTDIWISILPRQRCYHSQSNSFRIFSLDKTWISSLTLSFQKRPLFIILLDNRWCVVDCNPHSVLLGSRAWLTSVSGQSSVNLASPTLPDLSMEMFTTVNGPYVVQKEKKVAHTKSHPPQGKHWREWKQSPQHLSQKAHVLFSKAAALI